MKCGRFCDPRNRDGRIIVIASNDFLTDQVIRISASAGGTNYLNTLQLVENAVDWSLEDQGLLAIRSGSHFARTLYPLSQSTQRFDSLKEFNQQKLVLAKPSEAATVSKTNTAEEKPKAAGAGVK